LTYLSRVQAYKIDVNGTTKQPESTPPENDATSRVLMIVRLEHASKKKSFQSRFHSKSATHSTGIAVALLANVLDPRAAKSTAYFQFHLTWRFQNSWEYYLLQPSKKSNNKGGGQLTITQSLKELEAWLRRALGTYTLVSSRNYDTNTRIHQRCIADILAGTYRWKPAKFDPP